MPAKEDYEKYSSIADELELEDDEREDFISNAMSRRGYKPTTTWLDPEPDPNDEPEPKKKGMIPPRKAAAPKEDERPKRRGQYGE